MGLVVVSGEAPVLSSDETVGTHVVSLWVIDPFFLRKEYEDLSGKISALGVSLDTRTLLINPDSICLAKRRFSMRRFASLRSS